MHICLLLPYDMIARNYVSTGVILELLDCKDISKITVISRTKLEISHQKLQWQELVRPFKYGEQKPFTYKGFSSDITFTLSYYLHLILINRFNSIRGFKGFENRMRQSSRLHCISSKEGLPTSKWWGFPFRKHESFYSAIKAIYKSPLLLQHFDVTRFFKQNDINLLVLGHLQNHFISPYITEAMQNKIPVLGINGSWDQPTTKGPILFPFKKILAQNQRVKDDLIEFHNIKKDTVSVVGWPQMDLYSQQDVLLERSEFLRSIGIEQSGKYVVVGAYSERLGYHEPYMCELLAQYLANEPEFKDVIIYIRSHPLDVDWQKRMGYLEGFSNIMIEPPSSGNLPHLANLLVHASCVISSAGTISLDAVALDTPAIAVAFEDENLPYYDRPSRRYDMEHYAEVMKTEGVTKVTSQNELNQTVILYLKDKTKYATERKLLRESHLEPLDGNAAQRIKDHILVEAMR